MAVYFILKLLLPVIKPKEARFSLSEHVRVCTKTGIVGKESWLWRRMRGFNNDKMALFAKFGPFCGGGYVFGLLQNEKLLRNETSLDGDKSVQIAKVLQNATNHTSSFYGNDLRTAYQMMIRVLQYESQQQGFDLAATRDVEFNEVKKKTLDRFRK